MWDVWAAEYEEPGRRNWGRDEPSWGQWGVPESQLKLFPDSVEGLDTIELGCGTGYVSAWLRGRGRGRSGSAIRPPSWPPPAGCRPSSDGRSRSSRGVQRRSLSPTRASTWPSRSTGRASGANAYRWIPEAARLVRPGGQLVFLVNSPLLMCCLPDTPDGRAGERLLRPYIGMHRFEWSDDDSVEFHLGHGEMFRLLRANGSTVEELIEVEVPEGSTTRYPWVPLDWARRWPCEEIWKARRTAGGS